jgi:DNA topoisomerase-2
VITEPIQMHHNKTLTTKAPRKKGSSEKKKLSKNQTTKPRTRINKKHEPDEPVENIKNRKVKQISQLEHAKRKSMWVGSKKIQTTEMYCLSDDFKSFELKKVKFTPALYKIVDEIVVNAIDQWVNYPKQVNKISIYFNRETGVISVLNTGPSIGIYMTENLNGEKMYAAQLIAAEFLSGDNLDEDGDYDRVTGGTNGAGLKLTNAFSDYLTITTVEKKKHYTQTFRERLTIIEEPVIRKTTCDENESFTKIEFLPSYDVFGYNGGYKPTMANDLEKLIISRSYQAAAFTKADIYYNDVKIEIPVCETMSKKKNSKFYNFSNMFVLSDVGIWSTKIVSTDSIYKKFPWEICVGVSDGKFRHVSLINGIHVYDGGTHIKHLQNQIVSNLKCNVEKLIKKSKTKFNANYIINNLFIFFKGSIIKPEFSSQIKSILGDPIEKFESYNLKKKDYIDLWAILEPHIMSLFLDKYKDKKKNRVTRGAVNVPKCSDAKYAGHKTKYKQCTMIVCEGDSAMGTVHEGITGKTTKLNYDYYGTFSIQGVPMNARKEVSKYTDKTTNKVTLIRNSKLQKNERLSSLVKVLGLDYEKTYELNKKGDEEFATVRYVKITAAVDQDDDGKGNIFGLLINFIILFWPALANRGFITRFNTPIIRAYPKNKKKFVEEFESLKTYTSWVATKYGGDDEKVNSDFTLKYYKGLGSHKKIEIPQMFKDFESRLCVYQLDSDALQNLEAYFGENSELRKKALCTPVTRVETIGNLIDITEQLDRDLKAYQRDNIMRKLPHCMDGSVPSRRKVIYTARNVFGGSNSEMKVNAFVNETSRSTNYHHGESSLATTVTKMAQEFPGARHLPFLRPQGQFGTRSNGGKDAADPRYTFTQLNKRLCFAIFPKEDDFLLKYMFDDGDRCEPEYYVPVIPLSILENMELPATGWKVKLWARDYKEVIKNVRQLIHKKIKKANSMKIWLKDNIGTIRKYKGREYSVGKYEYDEDKNIIIVKELPLGKHSSSFIGNYASDDPKQLCNKPYFKSKPDDMTNDDGVDITFHLTETGWEELSAKYGNDTFDCVEDLMNLRTSLDDNINMIAVDGSVREFKKYEHVIDMWFPVRKQLYADRIDRHTTLTNLMIIYLKNIIRFTKAHQTYNITPKTNMTTVDEILKKNKYDTFNSALLSSPKYTEISKLRALIINNITTGTSYEYLIKLSYRDMIDCACKKREKQLRDYEDKLKELSLDDGGGDIFKGGKTWLKELDEVEKTIGDGISLGWAYGKDVARFR